MTLAAKIGEAKLVEERESRVQRLRAAAVPYLLLLPAVLALAAVSLYPTFDGIRASLHRFRYGLDMGFAGGDNFAVVYDDAVFWQAILTTAHVRRPRRRDRDPARPAAGASRGARAALSPASSASC